MIGEDVIDFYVKLKEDEHMLSPELKKLLNDLRAGESNIRCAINFIIDPLKTTNIEWMNYVNNGLKFFFLTVALSYFSNHMRMRKFRTV